MGVFASVEDLQCCDVCTANALGEKASEWVGFSTLQVPDDGNDTFLGLYLQHCLSPESRLAVRSVFASVGMTVTWDGSHAKTIFVDLHNNTGLAWKWLRFRIKCRFITQYWLEQTAHLHAPDAREGERALAQFGSGAWNETDGGPPGLTAAWRRVGFQRQVIFDLLDQGKFMRLLQDDALIQCGTSSEHAHPSELDEESFLSQTDLYMNGARAKRVSLSEVTVPDGEGTTRRALKGAELDAVAFRGPVLKLATYSTTASTFATHPQNAHEGVKDAVTEYVPHNGKSMSIAELHRTLEKNQRGVVRAEQFARKYDIDTVHFVGLYATDVDGVYDAKWCA